MDQHWGVPIGDTSGRAGPTAQDSGYVHFASEVSAPHLLTRL